MIGAALALFSPKSWKLVALGLAALAIAGVVTAGYLYLKDLQNDLLEAEKALVSEQYRRVAAEAAAEELQRQHDAQVKNLEILERQNHAAVSAWHSVLEELDALKTTDTPAPEGQAYDPAADLNRLNARANRMLEDATRP